MTEPNLLYTVLALCILAVLIVAVIIVGWWAVPAACGELRVEWRRYQRAALRRRLRVQRRPVPAAPFTRTVVPIPPPPKWALGYQPAQIIADFQRIVTRELPQRLTQGELDLAGVS